jgi:hypothetical protein
MEPLLADVFHILIANQRMVSPVIKKTFAITSVPNLIKYKRCLLGSIGNLEGRD